MTPHESTLDIGTHRLNCLILGESHLPALIMIHGIRDLSWGLLPVAENLAAKYRIYLPDLRGHGRSDHTGGYSMDGYLGDLYQLFDHIKTSQAVLFGHSLGGHIVSRFAALFPERVTKLMMVEGFGPPVIENDRESDIDKYRRKLLYALTLKPQSPCLEDTEDAIRRLQKNNPRMSADLAKLVAEKGTIRDSVGTLRWRFDPRVQQVFVNESLRDTARFWRQVTCPTLVVMGKLSTDYWSRMGVNNDYTQEDIAWRVGCFTDNTYICFENAGHMVPYDQPAHLASTMTTFLETTHE